MNLIKYVDRIDYAKSIKSCQIRSKWNSSQTYSKAFDYPPKSSGVYAIEITNMDCNSDEFLNSEIIYIGKSSNLSQRISGHEIVRIARCLLTDCFVKVYFKKCKNHHKIEKRLIRQYSPILNHQLNG